MLILEETPATNLNYSEVRGRSKVNVLACMLVFDMQNDYFQKKMVLPFDSTPGVKGVSVGKIFAIMLLHAMSALIIPTLFLKKRRGYCNRLCPSALLSPPRSLDEIQPNLVCRLLT